VMTWTEGRYRIVLPPLVLPAPPRAIRPSAADQRTLFGYASVEPAKPAREPALHQTQPLVPPSDAGDRITHPGRPVDVFDAAVPERTTDVGVPARAPAEPQAPHPRPTDGAGAGASVAAKPTAGGVSRDRGGGATLMPEPAITPATGVRTRDLARSRPQPETRATRRVAVRRRTLSDLPVAAHVGLGLVLGLAVVGTYWVIQSILIH